MCRRLLYGLNAVFRSRSEGRLYTLATVLLGVANGSPTVCILEYPEGVDCLLRSSLAKAHVDPEVLVCILRCESREDEVVIVVERCHVLALNTKPLVNLTMD